jgi:predicted aconitase with swiveling domain
MLSAAVMYGACRLSRQKAPFHLLVCAIAPPILAVEVIAHVEIVASGHALSLWGGNDGSSGAVVLAALGASVIAQTLVPPLCAAVALRAVWRLRLRTALPSAVVVGFVAHYCLGAFIRMWLPIGTWLAHIP